MIKPMSGEFILGNDISTSTDLFNDFLQRNGIKTLLYAGYALNYCVLNRPIGIVPVSQLHKYNIILLRDCSIAFETPETLAGKWTRKVITNLIETQFGRSTTTDELRTSFESINTR